MKYALIILLFLTPYFLEASPFEEGRRIVHMQAGDRIGIVVVCDDGTMWRLRRNYSSRYYETVKKWGLVGRPKPKRKHVKRYNLTNTVRYPQGQKYVK